MVCESPARLLASSFLAGALACACAPDAPAPSSASAPPSPPLPAAPPAGFSAWPERRVHGATGIVLVRLPLGRCVVGSPADEPKRDTDEAQHEVELRDEVWLGETEVTVGQWELVMGADFDAPTRDPALPIGNLTWYDAQAFVQRLDELGPPGWRLPREAEWEYACRAGTTTPFAFGADLRPEQACFDPYYPYRDGPRGEHTTGPLRVRSLIPNAWGFYDLHGNLTEWCEDVYVDAPGSEPPPESAGNARVLRGGSYVASADQVRSAWREGYPPKSDGLEYGFRVAWAPVAH